MNNVCVFHYISMSLFFSRGLGEYVHCQIVSDAPNLSPPKAISSPSPLLFSCLLTAGCHHSPFEKQLFPLYLLLQISSFAFPSLKPFPLPRINTLPLQTRCFLTKYHMYRHLISFICHPCFPQLYLITHMLNICSID